MVNESHLRDEILFVINRSRVRVPPSAPIKNALFIHFYENSNLLIKKGSQKMHVFLGKRNEFSQDVNSNEERIEIHRSIHQNQVADRLL